VFNDYVEALPNHKGDRTVGFSGPTGGDVSADPYAGQTAGNGKPIWSAQQAADNLSRAGVDWTFGNNGALDDGILTYGFWTEEEVENSYYLEDGATKILADSFYIQAQKFAAFTPEQQAMATANLQLWDDLIAVTFQKAASPAEADITFGFVQMSPAAGAHAYYPQEEAFDAYYGTEDLGKTGGDVWANYLYQDSFSGANAQIGAYGWFAITHELGHSLGLAHGGDYNASDDNDGDGQPDPITYEGDAYFFQDSQQYTIMSYFDGFYTGQSAVSWAAADTFFVMAQTPQVHDILSVQQIYGADMTTRAGNTVYGFNSTADRAVFDFTVNKTPVLTIWDAGGRDTLDLSGFNANNVIDINEGAFSSAGYKIDAASKAYFGAAFGLETEEDFADFYAANGLGPDGRPVDNIAIAYGAKIENATGGSGNDTLIGNSLSNVLTGNAGNDRFIGGDKTDVFVLGAGNDTVVGEIQSKVATKVGKLSLDIVKDFNLSGDDTIDLSGLDANTKVRGDQAFTFTGTGGANGAGQISYTTYANIAAAEKALNYDIDGVAGVGSVSGPVTVVFGNVDGGTADFGLILLGTSGVTASDFIF
jgi:serralysin